jgi:hypothetical protein
LASQSRPDATLARSDFDASILVRIRKHAYPVEQAPYEELQDQKNSLGFHAVLEDEDIDMQEPKTR